MHCSRSTSETRSVQGLRMCWKLGSKGLLVVGDGRPHPLLVLPARLQCPSSATLPSYPVSLEKVLPNVDLQLHDYGGRPPPHHGFPATVHSVGSQRAYHSTVLPECLAGMAENAARKRDWELPGAPEVWYSEPALTVPRPRRLLDFASPVPEACP